MSFGKTIWQGLDDGFDYSVRQLLSATVQEPATNSRNPENTFFRIPQLTLALDLRPDLYLSLQHIEFSAKPRLTGLWMQRKTGTRSKETEEDWDLFINEWLVRIPVSDRLFISYGRENLQWGPGWLFSPSNPFFIDNGRDDPKREIPGKDFARLVYLPDMTWTLSLIANMDEGRSRLEYGKKFKNIYGVKLDFTGEQTYAGLILAHREPEQTSLGAFGGWTFNDALLLYTDIGINEMTDKSESRECALLAGASYTLETGPTLTVEYGYQENRTDLFQRNDIMFQYSQNDIRGIFNLILRVTKNIDDNSAQLLTIVEYLAGDHVQFFLNTTVNRGAEDKEFGNYLAYRINIGFEYSF